MNTIWKLKQSLNNLIKKKKKYKNRAMKYLHLTLRKNFTTNGVHLRALVCKNQTNSRFRGKGEKFDFFLILILDGLDYN